MATREAAGLFDQSSFAKIDVQGPGAVALLQRLCANRVDRTVGAIAYTQMLNSRGGIESDFTVTRLGEQSFRIVTGTAFGNHDMAWIRKHLPDDGSVIVNDVTSGLACFCLWGPRARDILQPLTKSDLSNEAFRYMTAAEISVGAVPCLAARVTYVGELGWELYCPTEYGQSLWDALWEAGREHGMRACGYRAIDALRLEKGYRAWGTDITPEDTPGEAGLGFAVAAGQGRLHRPRGDAGRARARRPGAEAVLPDAGRPAGRLPRLGAGARSAARSSAASPPAATASRSSARSPTPTCRRRSPRSARPSRSRCSASGWRPRSPPSRCGIPAASASAAERATLRVCRSDRPRNWMRCERRDTPSP